MTATFVLLIAQSSYSLADWSNLTAGTDGLFLAPLLAIGLLFWVHWMRAEW